MKPQFYWHIETMQQQPPDSPPQPHAVRKKKNEKAKPGDPYNLRNRTQFPDYGGQQNATDTHRNTGQRMFR